MGSWQIPRRRNRPDSGATPGDPPHDRVRGVAKIRRTPDGVTVRRAYRRTPGTGLSDIWAMNVDGTNRRPVYVAPEDQFHPSFSPDMKQLLFATVKGREARKIQVMDVASGAVTTLVDSSLTSYDSAPAWSPDAKQIAFESTMDGDREIYVMNADGTNVRQLTHNTLNGTLALPETLRVAPSKTTWNGLHPNDPLTVTFSQHIGPADTLRTGTYSRTLTFSLSTTAP